MNKIGKIHTIGNDGYHYTAGYFTSNKWLGTDKLILARSIDMN